MDHIAAQLPLPMPLPGPLPFQILILATPLIIWGATIIIRKIAYWVESDKYTYRDGTPIPDESRKVIHHIETSNCQYMRRGLASVKQGTGRLIGPQSTTLQKTHYALNQVRAAAEKYANNAIRASKAYTDDKSMALAEDISTLGARVGALDRWIAQYEPMIKPLIAKGELITKAEAASLMQAAYNAAKADIDAFTKKWTPELEALPRVQRQIAVNVVAETLTKIDEELRKGLERTAELPEAPSDAATSLTNTIVARIAAAKEAAISELKAYLDSTDYARLTKDEKRIDELESGLKTQKEYIDKTVKPFVDARTKEIELRKPVTEALDKAIGKGIADSIAWDLVNADAIRRLVQGCGPQLEDWCSLRKDLLALLAQEPFLAFITFMTPYVRHYTDTMIGSTLTGMVTLVSRGA